MYTYNYNIPIFSIILVFILGYTYNYMRRYTTMKKNVIVHLFEYLCLGILKIVRVVILVIPF